MLLPGGRAVPGRHMLAWAAQSPGAACNGVPLPGAPPTLLDALLVLANAPRPGISIVLPALVVPAVVVKG
jgi:hypothetical protein